MPPCRCTFADLILDLAAQRNRDKTEFLRKKVGESANPCCSTAFESVGLAWHLLEEEESEKEIALCCSFNRESRDRRTYSEWRSRYART